MKCEECSIVLDDYVEHELSAKDANQVAAHLIGCAACARSYQMLTREQDAYAQYLRGVEATPALWIGLQARIHEEDRVRASRLLPRLHDWMTSAFGAPYLRPAQAVALALVAIGIIIGMIKYKTSGEASKHDAVVSRKSVGINAEYPSDKDSAATSNGTNGDYPGDHLNKKVNKIQIASIEKRTRKGRARFSAFNRPARFVIPEPEISSRDAGQNAKEQLMLALRITSTQLYVAQRKIQEEQRRTPPSTPVSEPNREMR